MSPISPRRRWLQFGLRSLILLTVACALGLTWWRQWRLASELERTESLERELAFQKERNRAYRYLDLDNPKHRETFYYLSRMPSWFTTLERQSLWTGGEKYELVFFRETMMSDRGLHSTVVLLRHGDKGDTVSCTSYRGSSWKSDGDEHQVKLEDADGDGALDLVFHRQWWEPTTPGGTTFIDRHSATAYRITPDGFREVGK